jgi:hypothetical protein
MTLDKLEFESVVQAVAHYLYKGFRSVSRGVDGRFMLHPCGLMIRIDRIDAVTYRITIVTETYEQRKQQQNQEHYISLAG